MIGKETTSKLDQDIDQLNSFLRGEIAAVESYQQCMEQVDHESLRIQLRALQASHRKRVNALAERIRSFGGTAAEESGSWGTFAQVIGGSAALIGNKAAVKVLSEGENHGLKNYQRDIPKLDPGLREWVMTQIMPEQQKTYEEVVAIKSNM